VTEAPPRLQMRELANTAGLLTIARLPLALVFPFVADRRGPALVIYGLAILTDVADGIVARRTGTTSYSGAVIDSYMDKALHSVVALTLVAYGRMPASWLILWFMREWMQLAMVVVFVKSYLRGEWRPRGANRLGKLTTVSLAVALIATLLEIQPLALGFSWLTGALGLATGLSYLRQILEDRQGRR